MVLLFPEKTCPTLTQDSSCLSGKRFKPGLQSVNSACANASGFSWLLMKVVNFSRFGRLLTFPSSFSCGGIGYPFQVAPWAAFSWGDVLLLGESLAHKVFVFHSAGDKMPTNFLCRGHKRDKKLVKSVENPVDFDRKACVEYVKQLIKQRGYTVSRLSDECGVSVDKINGVLYAKTAEPKLPNMAAVIKCLGGSLDEMLGIQAETPEGAVPAEGDAGGVHRAYLLGVEHGQASASKHIESLERDKRRLTLLEVVLGVLLLGVTAWFVWDVTHPDRGLIRYLMQSLTSGKLWG